MRSSRFLPFGLAVLALLALGSCGNHEPASSPQVRLEAVSGDQQTGTAGQELPEAIVVRAVTASGPAAGGVAVAGVTVRFAVTAGGGSLSTASAVTASDGAAAVRWTLGPAPVWNRVAAAPVGTGAGVASEPETDMARGHEIAQVDGVTFTAWADPGEPPALELVYQAPAGGPSEDLAFRSGRGLFLGSTGAILTSPGPGLPVSELPLVGEPIAKPVGIAFGAGGDLYVSDNPGPDSSAVKQITPAGVCSILSPGFGGGHFDLPNDLAVDGAGGVYVAATCDDMIYRVSADDGRTSEFLAALGPNGLAFNADYTYLYFTTENPALFCGGTNAPGGLYRASISPDGQPGPVETLLENVALAGDGLTFDCEGNLYVVFTGLLAGGCEGLFQSGVFVYTPDSRFHLFFAVNLPLDIVTNPAFGAEPFDPLSLYCYGFTGKLYRASVGIRGQALP